MIYRPFESNRDYYRIEYFIASYRYGIYSGPHYIESSVKIIESPDAVELYSKLQSIILDINNSNKELKNIEYYNKLAQNKDKSLLDKFAKDNNELYKISNVIIKSFTRIKEQDLNPRMLEFERYPIPKFRIGQLIKPRSVDTNVEHAGLFASNHGKNIFYIKDISETSYYSDHVGYVDILDQDDWELI